MLFLVRFYPGSGFFGVSKKDVCPPLQAAEPACSSESTEPLVLELIAESTRGQKSELDFLWACASS